MNVVCSVPGLGAAVPAGSKGRRHLPLTTFSAVGAARKLLREAPPEWTSSAQYQDSALRPRAGPKGRRHFR